MTGAELAGVIPALARLRIAVFRDFPYLYDGDAAYEADYLAHFAAADGAVVVVARDGTDIVGAATAAPLAAQDPAWRDPLAAAGFDIGRTFYFGESVLLGKYRGKGIGHAFFDHREAQARACGASHAAFCSVIRAEDHPMRPADHRPLDAFWRSRGYAPLAGVTATFDWKTVGSAEEQPHRLQYWTRGL
ncbi:GNAT family acetyltransferase [Sphingopyxis sp. H071]|nr:GNAT family acetyltransferase [Sphingopyxis sp. H057]KTE53119.1 GNAT family acetyltransferase [Sphingopyxis sp. H073]KTE55307.1 GNAT family acetyltransferase [Sphingopyxis sp. H071]KTE58754.1 GNAT family acetyltransferase [Sphingopyxis sp. H107]KTE61344.1 GNAT family acetyltransferase [Sphingopyxis sp. H100]KTE72810.1 GNAT family acetyltransferase [Sphingopyxis sp. H081]KTE80143.1 GNAT family acetyltransferase [Sphingopyxis sp. H067]